MATSRPRVRTAWALELLMVAALGACRNDPEVEKQRALERGNAYFAKRQYAEATFVVPCAAAFLSTTATGGSARMLSDGITIWNLSLPSSFTARNASFSHANRTSPILRFTKVVVLPRAPESRTGTFKKSLRTNSWAFA